MDMHESCRTLPTTKGDVQNRGRWQKPEAAFLVRNAQEQDSLDRKVQRHRSVHADLHWSPVNHSSWDPAPPMP